MPPTSTVKTGLRLVATHISPSAALLAKSGPGEEGFFFSAPMTVCSYSAAQFFFTFWQTPREEKNQEGHLLFPPGHRRSLPVIVKKSRGVACFSTLGALDTAPRRCCCFPHRDRWRSTEASTAESQPYAPPSSGMVQHRGARRCFSGSSR